MNFRIWWNFILNYKIEGVLLRLVRNISHTKIKSYIYTPLNSWEKKKENIKITDTYRYIETKQSYNGLKMGLFCFSWKQKIQKCLINRLKIDIFFFLLLFPFTANYLHYKSISFHICLKSKSKYVFWRTFNFRYSNSQVEFCSKLGLIHSVFNCLYNSLILAFL